MKKLIAILLVLLMIAPSALALDISDFNDYAVIFGEKELKGGEPSSGGQSTFTWFEYDGGEVAFREVDGELNAIAVYGKDGAFISYCCAAIMTSDSNADNAIQNLGTFMLCLQLKKGEEESTEDKMFTLADGSVCGISNDDRYGFRLMVMK